MKEIKPISNFLSERRRQDICSGCGKSIEDPEKECPTCGAFPHKAYHERAAAKTLGISKWLQNAPVMQPNQKLSENTKKLENMNNIIKFGEFVESRIQENEVAWSSFDEAYLEECVEEMFGESLNEASVERGSLIDKLISASSGIASKISKGMGQTSPDPKIDTLVKAMNKGIAEVMIKTGNNPAAFKKGLAENKEIKKISDVYVNSLNKLISSAKKDPSVLLSKDFGKTLASLYIIRKVAKTIIGKQGKGYSDAVNMDLSKAVSYKSATPMPSKKKTDAKPGAKATPAKPEAPKAEAPKAEATPASTPSAPSSTETTTTPEDKKTA